MSTRARPPKPPHPRPPRPQRRRERDAQPRDGDTFAWRPEVELVIGAPRAGSQSEGGR
jgi:hypothetical protein